LVLLEHLQPQLINVHVGWSSAYSSLEAALEVNVAVVGPLCFQYTTVASTGIRPLWVSCQVGVLALLLSRTSSCVARFGVSPLAFRARNI